jgi:hypothetical protein
MAPISVQFLDIRAGISRSPWDALFHRGGYRVSSRPHRMWLPASTMRFVPQCGRKDGCLAATSLFSATETSGCKASCSVQQGSPLTHILDWFHLSMRLRHIEQTWQGLRHIGDLNIYLRDVAIDVPRLRHLLWSGYVREATRAVKNMLYQLEQHATLRDANQKLKRLSVLISNLRSYLVQNATSIVGLLPSILVGSADIEFSGRKRRQ